MNEDLKPTIHNVDIDVTKTYNVDIECDQGTFSVAFYPAGFGYDTVVLNVDENDEVTPGSVLYEELCNAANAAIDAQEKAADIHDDLQRIIELSDPNKMRTPDMLFRELQLINIIAKQLIKNH